jgi:catalase
VSFDDHYSQATLFYRSMTAVEQTHIVEAYTFELGKVYEQLIKERVLGVLANIDAELCARVAAGLGLPAPAGNPAENVTPSPALSQVVDTPGPIAGRKIAVVADAGSDLAGIGKLRTTMDALGVTVLVLAPAGGVLGKGRKALAVDRTILTTRSIEFDAIVIAGGTTPSGALEQAILLQEAYRHCKALAAWGDGEAILSGAGIPLDGPGIAVADTVDKAFTASLTTALGLHRAWDRGDLVPASAVPPKSPAGGNQAAKNTKNEPVR